MATEQLEAIMNATFQAAIPKKQVVPSTMRALVFHGPNQIGIEQAPIPRPGPGEAVIRVTLTTICGTDLHILKGEYPVKSGLVIGHAPTHFWRPASSIPRAALTLTIYGTRERAPTRRLNS